MKFSLLLIVLTTLIAESHQRVRELFFYNVSLIVNEKYINESNVNIQCEVHTRVKPCIYAPAIKFFLTQDVARVYVQIKAMDVIKNRVILDQLLNICMFDNQSFDVLIKVIFERLKEHVSFPVKCPFKKVRK
jgi:hypothetical protein